MKVIWMEQAYTALSDTIDYVRQEYGDKFADRIVKEAFHVGVLLEDNPNLGAIEPLLSHLPITYRSIVINHLNKIIYRIVEDRIEIADFWDVRREPKSLASQIE